MTFAARVTVTGSIPLPPTFAYAYGHRRRQHPPPREESTRWVGHLVPRYRCSSASIIPLYFPCSFGRSLPRPFCPGFLGFVGRFSLLLYFDPDRKLQSCQAPLVRNATILNDFCVLRHWNQAGCASPKGRVASIHESPGETL